MSAPITWPLGAWPVSIEPATVVRIKHGKGPNDKTVVDCDFAGALSAIDNDTIVPGSVPTVTIIRNDGGAADCYTPDNPTISPDATRVAVWLLGGSVGYEYLVSVSVQTVGLQALTRSFIIPCTLR